MTDGEIEGELIAPDDDAEYLGLLERLDKEFPPLVKGSGFDFKKIRGNFRGRSAKAMVLHMSTTGWSINEIAEALEVAPATASRYLGEALCDACPLEDTEILRKFELSKLDTQERMIFRQFQRSCEDEVSETEEWRGEDEKGREFPVAEGEGSRVLKRVRKGQSGNPAYMRLLQDISKRRAALLGLDAPTKTEVNKTEKKLQITEVVVRSRDDVEKARQAGLLESPGS